MSIVAKMVCHSSAPEERIEQIEKAGDGTAAVVLGAVYEPNDEKRLTQSENAIFGKYTPWGECKMGIANPDALRFFKPGKAYYVTFTEAP